MLKQNFIKVAQKLALSGTFKIHNFYGALNVGIEIAFFTIGCVLLTKVPHFSLGYWVLQFLLGLCLFRFFVLLHECGHKTLFSKKSVNTIIGTLISIPCIVPYIPWRNVHYLHHRWVGVVDKDPTQATVLKIKDSSSFTQNLFRLIWKTWLPVSFFKLMLEVFWSYPVKEWKEGKIRFAKAGLVSVIAIVLAHTFLIWHLSIGEYLVLYAPMLLIYAIWFENMNFSQHVGLFPYLSEDHPQPIPLHEQDAISRTTKIPSLLAVLFVYNFNLHIEHHLFPAVPWYYLPRIKRAIAGIQSLDYKGVGFPDYILDLRKQDPVDIYLKTLPPHDLNQKSVLNNLKIDDYGK